MTSPPQSPPPEPQAHPKAHPAEAACFLGCSYLGWSWWAWWASAGHLVCSIKKRDKADKLKYARCPDRDHHAHHAHPGRRTPVGRSNRRLRPLAAAARRTGGDPLPLEAGVARDRARWIDGTARRPRRQLLPASRSGGRRPPGNPSLASRGSRMRGGADVTRSLGCGAGGSGCAIEVIFECDRAHEPRCSGRPRLVFDCPSLRTRGRTS